MIGLTTKLIVCNTRNEWLYTIIVKGDRYVVSHSMRYRGKGNQKIMKTVTTREIVLNAFNRSSCSGSCCCWNWMITLWLAIFLACFTAMWRIKALMASSATIAITITHNNNQVKVTLNVPVKGAPQSVSFWSWLVCDPCAKIIVRAVLN